MKTKLANVLTDILDEGFEIPSCTLDLQDLIDSCIAYYNDMPYCRSTTRNYKLKLNELITELNDRRQMHIYNYVR